MLLLLCRLGDCLSSHNKLYLHNVLLHTRVANYQYVCRNSTHMQMFPSYYCNSIAAQMYTIAFRVAFDIDSAYYKQNY